MLSIYKEPFYKNKLFLSSFAILAGFVVTTGFIRTLSSSDSSVQQSTGSSGKSSLLIPIKSSQSETNSEKVAQSETTPDAQIQTSSSAGSQASKRSTSPTKGAANPAISQPSVQQPVGSTPPPPPTSDTPVDETPVVPIEPIQCRDSILNILVPFFPPLTSCPEGYIPG